VTTILIILGISVVVILIAWANLNAVVSPVHEKNDYGEKHRSS